MSTPLVDRLFGIFPPTITPLNEARRFNAAAGQKLYEYMLSCGVHGLFVLGTSGEAPYLRLDDKELIIKTAVKTSGGKVPVLAGVLEAGTDLTVEQARIAEQAGADGIVVITPFYYPNDQRGILEHFRAVKAAVKVPLLAYDIPQTTNLKISLDTMLKLVDEGIIIGAKDSSPDVNNTRRLLAKTKGKLKVFTGSEILADSVIKMGGVGVVPGLANVAPREFVVLYDLLKAGKIDEATAQQEKILKIFEVFLRADGQITFGYTINAMKTAMQLRGIIPETYVCRPFEQIDAAGVERVRSILTETGSL